jgi:uncharacterized Zn-binding protein involved in type VI secretion
MSDNYAVRVGDMHYCPAIDGASYSFLCFGGKPHEGGPIQPAGAASVVVEGQNAARVGDPLQCQSPAVDFIVTGVVDVLIEGKNAARFASKTAHGGEMRSSAANVIFNGAACGCTLGSGPDGPAAEECKIASEDRQKNAARIKKEDPDAEVQKTPSQQNYENGCGPEAVRHVTNSKRRKAGEPGYITEKEQIDETGKWKASDDEVNAWKERKKKNNQELIDNSKECDLAAHSDDCRIYFVSGKSPFYRHSTNSKNRLQWFDADGEPYEGGNSYAHPEGFKIAEDGFKVSELKCTLDDHPDDCVVYRVDVLYRQHTANPPTENEEDRPPYDPNDDTTNADDQKDLLEGNGVPAETKPLDPDGAINDAAEGKGVIVPVDAGAWYGNEKNDGDGHVVQVIGVKYDENGKPVKVYVNDTGDEAPPGCGKEVDYDHFVKAQERFKENAKVGDENAEPKYVSTKSPVF